MGDDLWGRFCLDDMAGRGIDLSRGRSAAAALKTGVTVSITSPRDRALVSYLGAISALTGADVPDAALRGLDHLHVSSFFFQDGLRPGCRDLFARARRLGLTTSLDTGFDPSQALGRRPARDARARPTSSFRTRSSSRALTGCEDPEEGLRALENGRTRVVAKLGNGGRA